MAKRILAGCLAAVILAGLGWYGGFLHSESRAGKEQEKLWQELMSLGERIAAQEQEQEERTVQEQPERAEASAAPDSVVNDTGSHEYYLVEEDGRVTIYRIEGQTLFEYTGITVDSLPEELQGEIAHGKRVSGEKELYDFLENYSS